MTDDEEPTEEELEEAAALAHALERGTSDDVPGDALATAALLRYHRDGGELRPERRAAILDEIFESARPQPTPATNPDKSNGPEEKSLGWLKWLFPVGGLSLAGAAAVLLLTMMQSGGGPVASAPHAAVTVVPAPSLALLSAQAAAAAGDEVGANALDTEMRQYRGALYAALENRYR